MTDHEKKYLSDIIRAIELIENFTSSISDYEEYISDLKTQSAIERQLAIIGEAVNKIENSNRNIKLKNAYQIIGLRNRLIHAYDSIDNTIIWAILKRHITPLKVEVKKLLE